MEINFLENKSLLTHHLSLIDSYRHLIVGSDSIKAAVIVGSFARGNPDRFSDIDLVAFAEKDCFELAAQELFEPKFFPTMHTFGKDFTPNVKFKKTIYDNFVSAEIHLFSSTFDFKLRKPYISIKDQDDFLSSKLTIDQTTDPSETLVLNHGIDGLGWELLDLLKWWQRGQRQRVFLHLSKISKFIDKTNSTF